ncbi:cAMP-regulated phosphoprotein 19-related protein [Heracleum sosnowskyi]|uniref:cAMP-regulated phosphoprotein 19-related protein n=1 Tax=Heracleum sosnowskyi TaxID=360622 RepID=A0AAD8H4E2_9APIA|nr:cAMP-regulated phosphoprotein 19-related protein [Heracleum sosnowskyi]
MSGKEDAKQVKGDAPMETDSSSDSAQQEEEVIKKKYGGIVPKKTPLISKDHERAYFDSADWALGKQGAEKPKGPPEALRPKLEPTHQPTRYRKSPCAPSDGEDGSPSQDSPSNE